MIVVIVPLTVVAIVVGALRRGPRLLGWRGASLWAVASFTLGFSIVTGLSYGLYLLPIALVLVWLAAARSRAWPEVLGIGGGVIALVVLIAVLQRIG
jgi:hypothetical protein